MAGILDYKKVLWLLKIDLKIILIPKKKFF